MINSVPTMILKHDMRLECLIFKILQIVELLLIAKTLFKDLLTNQISTMSMNDSVLVNHIYLIFYHSFFMYNNGLLYPLFPEIKVGR